MLKIAVCDDEKYYLTKIAFMIEEILEKEGISVYRTDTYLSGMDFLQKSNKLSEYDVVFLDINMPDVDGMTVAKKLRESRPDILLIFVTAFIDYAVEGYKMEATRFLLKDMLEDMLPECMSAIIRKLALQTKKVKYNFIEGEREIPIDSIRFIESSVHKLFFHICDKKQQSFTLYDKLDNVEGELISLGFLRIHKSFLVNTKYIESMVNYKVTMNNGKILPIPREKYQKVKERYYEIMGDIL